MSRLARLLLAPSACVALLALAACAGPYAPAGGEPSPHAPSAGAEPHPQAGDAGVHPQPRAAGAGIAPQPPAAGAGIAPQPPAARAGAQSLDSERAARLVAAAIARTLEPEVYDGSYVVIAYPGGDVPEDRGVCTDLVVRSYRDAFGIDLQQLVHEDMKRAFAAYPPLWGLPAPDPNIDHRRVPNLRTFFARQGAELGISQDAAHYAPGDLVTWQLPNGRPHIGIVTDRRSPDGQRPLIAHNIGNGSTLEDMLFEFPITGRYRYGGPR